MFMKKHLYTIFFSFLLFTGGTVFSQNALDFDGDDDQIIVPDASALIAGSDLSLSFCVFPTNPAPSYPDFDGMAGFRNNLDADFYILHLEPTTVEARFRNSLGVNFDILYSGLNPSAWNHFAMTYDGVTLTLYHNGEYAAAIAASGAILDLASPFFMGFLPWPGDTFSLDGRLDDVCLWNKALTGNEVGDLYASCAVDLDADGLQLCYEFNQGVPGGDNTAITTAIDSKGNIDGPMTGFALTGASSNFVSYLHSGFQYLSESTCGEPYTSPSGNYTWSSSGAYTDTIFGSACTEIYFINLSVVVIDTSVTQTGPGSLSANQTAATYQWIDCETGEPVAGATGKNFEAPESGSYAVVVTKNACTDTSSCYNLVVSGTSDIIKKGVKISPNPFSDQLFINLGPSLPAVHLRMFNTVGEIVWSTFGAGGVELKSDLSALPEGLYYLLVTADNMSGAWKLIKN